MTSRDFIRVEEQNTDRIILYREGLFWKAYERSAFAVCTQIRPFKPTRRVLKALDGGDLISIGFPSATEEKVLAGLTRLETGPDRLVLAAAREIVVAEFRAWKSAVPLAAPRERSAATHASENPSPHVCAAPAEVGAPAAHGGVPAPQEPHPLTGLPVPKAPEDPDFALSTARVVARRISGFDLASSTPMECMLFLSELKKMLSTPDDRGTIR